MLNLKLLSINSKQLQFAIELYSYICDCKHDLQKGKKVKQLKNFTCPA